MILHNTTKHLIKKSCLENTHHQFTVSGWRSIKSDAKETVIADTFTCQNCLLTLSRFEIESGSVRALEEKSWAPGNVGYQHEAS